VATTDGALGILGALLVTGEALESSFTGTLSTLGALLSKILLTDVAAALTRAEVAGALLASWALVLADVTKEALVAFAHRIKLVVHSAFSMSRAKVLILVTRAKEVALASKEARHTLACSGAIFTEDTVALTIANCESVALALTARAFECTLVTEEARVACAFIGLVWSGAATHELARLQEEGRIGVELVLAR